MNEQFSAFLDGEAARDEADSVVNQLLRDGGLRASWSRQHWLRTTLRAHRGEMPGALDDGFSTRVMQAVSAESGDREPHDETAVARVPPHVAPRRRRWRGMTAGLAVAASAAGMVFLVNGNGVLRDDAGGDSAAGSATVATNVTAASSRLDGQRISSTRALANMHGLAKTPNGNVAMSDISAAGTGGASKTDATHGPADHWSVSDPALADELNGYLVDHNGLARGYGLSGTTPAFVRVASYGQELTQ